MGRTCARVPEGGREGEHLHVLVHVAAQVASLPGCIAGTYDQSGEAVYTMALCGDRLVVGTSNRKV